MAGETDLLLTKLRIPKSRPQTVLRPKLTNLIGSGLSHKLSLISAPPGSGKTTLLSEWRTTPDGAVFPLAWVSLDESDNDPVRFWRYAITALRALAPALGEESLAELATPQPASMELVITSLINSVLEELDTDFALVLDDYHFIRLSQIHSGVAYLLEHMPDHMHLLIATRHDPVELPLSRLRVRNQLVEIRSEDLRFTLEDATAFFQQVKTLERPLGKPEIEMLQERTEGWAAGLQLAALSLRGQKDPATFIRSFSGSQGLVLDYLADEVLYHQTQPVREFLLHTAFLGQLNAALARAVSGQADSQQILERLDQANLFVTGLDNNREWYRYHPLFAEFLVSILKRTMPHKLDELHRRAAVWYEANGFEVEALTYSLEARDYPKVVELLSILVMPLVHQGQTFTVISWFEALPAEFLSQNPGLNNLYATALMIANRFDKMEAPLDQAENSFRQSGDADGLRLTLALRSLLAQVRGETETSKALVRAIHDLTPSQDDLAQTIANVMLGGAYLLEGAVEEAESWLNRAWNPWIEMQIHNMLAEANFLRGNLKGAMQQSQDLLELNTRNTWQEGFAQVRLGRIYYEWNQLEEARYWLDQAISRSQYQEQSAYLPEAYLALARVEWAAGKKDLTFQALDKAAQAAQRLKHRSLKAKIKAWEQHFNILGKELDTAWSWIKGQKLDLITSGKLNFQEERDYLNLAQALLTRGQAEEALLRLDFLARFVRAQGRNTSLVEILGLKALALEASSQKEAALTALEESLELAFPAGIIRFYLDEGIAMQKLLVQLKKMKPGFNFLGRLLNEFESYSEESEEAAGLQVLKKHKQTTAPDLPTLPPARQGIINSLPLVEPLTERELEVLRLIGEGISNKAIAGKLILSLSTVKTHINNLYSKLGVENRVQALARAQNLKLF